MPSGQPGFGAVAGSMKGVNKPKLGAGGARPTPQSAQGLSPSYARRQSTSGLQDVASRMNQQQPLIQTPPEGPSTQGYGKPAVKPSPNMAKTQPTGGVQMGAVNKVGSAGSMNPNSGMMGGMVAKSFGDMGRPGMAFQPATPLEEQSMRPVGPSPNAPVWNRIAGNMGPMLQAYQNRGMNPGPVELMNQPGAISPEYMGGGDNQILGALGGMRGGLGRPDVMPRVPPPGGYDMGAVSVPQVMNAPPPPDAGGLDAMARPSIVRNPPPEMGPQPMMGPNDMQSGIGPSPQMMQQVPQMMPRPRGRWR